MTDETPRGDDREALKVAVERGLRACRVEDAPNPLIREGDLLHATHMVTDAVLAEGFTRAPQDDPVPPWEQETGWTDAQIDAELLELRSFVAVETRHYPTVGAVNRLRRAVADRLARAPQDDRAAQATAVTIPRPQIHTGPKHQTVDEATVAYLHEAANRVRTNRYWGSGVSHLVATVLNDTADTLAASPVAQGERGQG